MRIYELEELVSLYGPYMTLEDLVDALKGDRVHKCPKCHGKGFNLEYYNSYPSGLPDSGFVYQKASREIKCDLCHGFGYTEDLYKERTETKIIGYTKEK